MMALGGEELDERRASLSICPGFSSARPRKQRGKKTPLLTTSSRKKRTRLITLFINPLFANAKEYWGGKALHSVCVPLRILSSLCERVSIELRSRYHGTVLYNVAMCIV